MPPKKVNILREHLSKVHEWLNCGDAASIITMGRLCVAMGLVREAQAYREQWHHWWVERNRHLEDLRHIWWTHGGVYDSESDDSRQDE